MGWWAVILALAAPALAVTLWLRLLWEQPRPGDWPSLVSYGYVLGSVATAILLGLYGRLGFPLTIWPLSLVFVLTAAIASALLWRRSQAVGSTGYLLAMPSMPSMPFLQKLVFGALVLWLGLRFLGFAQEIWWRPLFPWDAWTTWGLRARTWTELKALVPFVSPAAWLADPDGQAQTIPAWHYPETISLLSTWSTLAFGEWNEAVANLPWLGCGLALALGFYGQSRRWGASPPTALVFVWLLLSLPMLDTHIALAGYADLWLATALGFAFMSFLVWAREDDPRQGLLSILFLTACILIKVEGLVWVMLFVPALVAVRPIRRRWAVLSITLFVVLGLVLLLIRGLCIEMHGTESTWFELGQIEVPYLGSWRFRYHDSWGAIRDHLFLYSNWHLLGYLVMVVLAWRMLVTFHAPSMRWQRGADTWVFSALLAYYFLFFWTDASLWATQATSVNRIFLHFVPALVFWMMTIWQQIQSVQTTRPFHRQRS